MFTKRLEDHAKCFQSLTHLDSDVTHVGEMISHAVGSGQKVLICGNGGSAADSQHFAAELIGRFQKDRHALPAIALTTDTSILTAVANDYSFADVFARQVDGLGKPGDILIGVSTSGNSDNVIRAVNRAKNAGMKTIGLLGGDGGKLKAELDVAIIIPHTVTARIQEAHIFILHFWAEQVEKLLDHQ